jgi:hypothetical protein
MAEWKHKVISVTNADETAVQARLDELNKYGEDWELVGVAVMPDSGRILLFVKSPLGRR